MVQNRIKRWGHNTAVVALNVFTVILSLVVAVLIVGIFSFGVFERGYSWHADEDSFYYSITDGDYACLVENYHQNIVSGYADNKDLQEYYGAARYFEAASLYHAYDVAGNEEMKEKFRKKMEEAKAEMGCWAVAGEQMDKTLGLQ